MLQVISNLLSNAFRWTPDGGRIELELAADNGTVRVDVADSGPGITAGQRSRIFEPFISNDVNGTGLGLPIAKELAIALGGGSSSLPSPVAEAASGWFSQLRSTSRRLRSRGVPDERFDVVSCRLVVVDRRLGAVRARDAPAAHRSHASRS